MIKALLAITTSIIFSIMMPAHAKTTIRIGHDSQESSPVHQAMLYFKQELEQQSNGDMRVEIYPARQLGNVRETTEMVQQGNLQMTFGASVLLSPYVPEFSVLDLFYLFRDVDHAHKALDSEKIGKPLLKAMESKGFKGLGFMEIGFRSVTNNRRPVESLEDFRGLKIRAASNPAQIRAWQSVGTAPTPLAWGEIFTSLQQGLINSQESGLYSIYAERFYESQKYLSLTDHIYTNYVLFMNKPFWNNLSADQQKLVQSVSNDTIKLQRELTAKQNAEVIATLKSEGMTVNVVDNGVRDQMKERMNAAVYDSLRERTGAELFDAILDEVNTL